MRVLAIVAALTGAAMGAQQEVWLTPERKAALERVAYRPRIIAAEREGSTVVYRWSNGAREWVTTNPAHTVTGAKARNAWQEKIDEARAEKAALIKEIKALANKGAASKKELEAVVEKHDSQKEIKEKGPQQ